MSYKLIIADKSPAALEALRLAFMDSGYDVYSFNNGEEVIESLSHIEPDSCVLGISLKEKSGLEVGKYIRESQDYKDIPILFLIGAYEELDKEKASKISNQGLFREPFDSMEIARKVKNLIQGDNGLDTLPEEPSLDEWAEMERNFQRRLEAVERNTGEKIRNMVKKEIYEAMKELEKRVKASVLREIRDKYPKKIK